MNAVSFLCFYAGLMVGLIASLYIVSKTRSDDPERAIAIALAVLFLLGGGAFISYAILRLGGG